MSVKSLFDGTAYNSTLTQKTVNAVSVNTDAVKTGGITSDNAFVSFAKKIHTPGIYCFDPALNSALNIDGTTGNWVSDTLRSDVVSDTPAALVIGVAGGIGVASSTRESKMNFDMNFSTAPLSQLKVYKYNYRQVKDGVYTDVPVAGDRYGLIYDEVKTVCPHMCVDDKAGKPITVDYVNLIYMLLKKVQEQEIILSRIIQKYPL